MKTIFKLLTSIAIFSLLTLCTFAVAKAETANMTVVENETNDSGELCATLVQSGIVGDNLIWRYYDDGSLVFEGDGAMYDYESYFDAPWYNYQSSIKSITILGNVTNIDD